MATPFATDEQMQTGADAVVELALLAFGPDWLRWTPDVNCALTEFAWNVTAPGQGEVLLSGLSHEGKPEGELLALLQRERRARFPDLACLLSGLTARVKRGELVFTFDLSFDDGEHWRPCEMAVDFDGPAYPGGPHGPPASSLLRALRRSASSRPRLRAKGAPARRRKDWF